MSRTDAERLRLFCDRVDRAFFRRAIIDSTIAASFHSWSTDEEGPQFETNLGDEEDVPSLLLEVRRFFADREHVFFPGIANIVERVVTDEEPREANRMNRDSWKRAAVGGAGGIFPHVDGVNYTPAYCFDIVVNGQLFHDDAEKAAHFERLNDMQQAYVLVNVNGILTEALNILRAERNLIWAAFERGAVTV